MRATITGMRKAYWAILVLTLLWTQPSHAQDVPKDDLKTAQQFLESIRKPDKVAIAKLVRYPLRRRQPLPPIVNEKDFAENFEDFFDSKTVAEVLADTEIWNTWRGTAIGRGLVWIDSGQIKAINLSTSRQDRAAQIEKTRIAATLHPSARNYDSVAFMCKTKSYQIRVHDDKGTLRYYSWKANQPLSSKPDLALTGKMELEGNGGNATFTFKNGEYTYLLDRTVICGPDCNSYLVVLQGNSTLLREACDDKSLLP
jgi:hypothetical protein